jgi:hypothetical protein
VTGAIEKLAASGQLEALEIDGVQLHGKRGEKEYVGRWRFLAGRGRKGLAWEVGRRMEWLRVQLVAAFAKTRRRVEGRLVKAWERFPRGRSWRR